MSALASSLVLLAAGAWQAPSVDVAGCPDLSADRIAEHLMVEHPEFRDSQGPHVELTCHETTVAIVVHDAVTHSRVQRTVEAPAEGKPGRERQVALATSSLIVASRTEPEDPVSGSQDTTPPVADESVRADPTASIQVTAAIRFRDLGTGLIVSHAGARAGWLIRRNVELFGQLNVEYGQVSRVRGQVNAVAALVGPGVAWTLRPDKRVGFETWAAVMAGYARLAGRTTAPDVDAGVLRGATGEVEVGFGPKLRAGSFVMVLDLRAGYTLPTPRGNVTGEAPVQHGGFWTGIGLRAGGLVGTRVR